MKKFCLVRWLELSLLESAPLSLRLWKNPVCATSYQHSGKSSGSATLRDELDRKEGWKQIFRFSAQEDELDVGPPKQFSVA